MGADLQQGAARRPAAPDFRCERCDADRSTKARPRCSSKDLSRAPSSSTSRTTPPPSTTRSEEHTSELQSLMRISYAVFCLKKKNNTHTNHVQLIHTHAIKNK